MDIDVFKNGAQWLRADFHLHTKAANEFRYTGENDYFALSYISKLKQEDIRIAFITNHNKFDEAEFKELRNNAEREGIYLIPGLEFSLKDGAKGIHLLIAFEDSWIYNKDHKNYIQTFLDSAFVNSPNNYDCFPYYNSNFDLDDTFKKLNEYGLDYFFIMPHVDDSSGLFNELVGRNLEKFLQSDAFEKKVCALQKSRTRDHLKSLEHEIALVEGTDCAEAGIEGIGHGNMVNGIEQKTYMKIGDYSFEAVKYALMDFKDRIRSTKPSPKNAYIKSIHIDGGKLDGQTIDFSPELNSLIGIRGSGKSAIIEIIRYVLDIPLSNSSADVPYKKDLIDYVVGSGAKITLFIIDRHGEEFSIEKIYSQKETIYNKHHEICNCSINALFDDNFPIYFGQKDLSSKDVDFQADLLKRLIGNRLTDIHKKIEAEKRIIQNTILEMQKSGDTKVLKEETENIIKNTQQKLLYFKEKGVENKLEMQTQFDNDGAILLRNKETLVAFRDELQTILQNYETFFSYKVIKGSEYNKDIFKEVNDAFSDAFVEFEKLKNIEQKTGDVLQKFDKIISKFEAKKESMKEDFAKIKRELNSDTLNPDTFLSLNRIEMTSKLKLGEINKIERERTDLMKQLQLRLEELNKLWVQEYKTLESETRKINEINDSLKIKLTFKGSKDKFLDKLRTVFRGTGIRDFVYQKLSEQFEDFIDIYKRRDELGTIINENQIGSFNEKFQENLVDLLTYEVDYQITIEYKGKSLEKHSLGQRASALILFLLAQKDNDILIIDQPEDDLDNQTIYDEVIKELIKLKGEMQFIFATHNANIPVLGDSEKVLSCSFDNDAISIKAGSIDTPSIQKSIVGIMEGGNEAFKRRKEIYSIWNF